MSESSTLTFQSVMDPAAWSEEPAGLIYVKDAPSSAKVPDLRGTPQVANVYLIAALKDAVLAYAQVAAFEGENVPAYCQAMLTIEAKFAVRASTATGTSLAPLIEAFVDSFSEICVLGRKKDDFSSHLNYALEMATPDSFDRFKERLVFEFGAGVVDGALKKFVASLRPLLGPAGPIYVYLVGALGALIEGKAESAFAFFDKAFLHALTAIKTPIPTPKPAPVVIVARKKKGIFSKK
jgi:hypothetical protein